MLNQEDVQTRQLPQPSRRRRTAASSQGGILQGLKMIFDHDSEEEAELQALQPSSSSSSASEEEEEEQVRTDIIKFKKRLQRQQEVAHRKIQKAVERKQKVEQVKQQRVFDKFNGFIENKSLAEIQNRRKIEVQPSLYIDQSATETESESEIAERRPRRRENDSSSSGPEDGASGAFQKVKRELKGVLALGLNKNSAQNIDGKLGHLLQQQQLKAAEQVARINMQKQLLREKLHQRKQKKQDTESQEFLADIYDQLATDRSQEEAASSANLQFLTDESAGTIDFSYQTRAHIEFVESQAIKSSEEHLEYLKKQEEERQKRLLMKRRYDNRHCIDDFLRPILNIDLLDRYHEQVHKFEKLPENFVAGHFEYLERWELLFMYEVYNLLLNSRRSTAKEEEHAEQQNQANSIEGGGRTVNIQPRREMLREMGRRRKLHWMGYFVCGQKDMLFQNIRMYEKPPGAADPAQTQPQAGSSETFQIKQVREHDLLILSEEEIDLKGSGDIKRVSSMAFLRGLLFKYNAMFAFVTKRAPKSGFATLQVDISKAFFLEQAESEHTYAKLHCYHYENLATTVREFKTLKMSEFYRMAPILIQPSMALERKDELLLEYRQIVEEALGITAAQKKQEAVIPMLHAKNVVHQDDKPTMMRKYARRNRKLYNPSQLIVLDKVIDMPENDILLIQGPPGTGKTHTITGIISMLLSSDVKKIMVCAPSNAAIDEVISRISVGGFLGSPGEQAVDSILEEGFSVEGMVVRLGALEYEPSPAVKKHTLDERLQETMNGNKASELRQKIDYARELLEDLQVESTKDGEGLGYLRLDNRKHVNYLLILVSQNPRRVKEFVKRQRKEEHVEFLKKALAVNERKLGELLSGENQKQGSDWKYIEQELILQSRIICCTLSISGTEKLEIVKDQIDYLIVDEACQCVEQSTLIPFELGPKRVILVGDQNQLPATTFSDNSIQTNFSRSLFERLLQSGYEKTMLQIQYRMHPSIRKFPSKQFYDNQISDHESITRRKLSSPLQKLAELLKTRLIFFDIKDSRETTDDRSRCNMDEAEFTKQLVEFIAFNSTKTGTLKAIAGSIGVITPYKSQVRHLKNRLGPLCRSQDCQLQATVEVNTVDAFQGREKDIIIFNCVRSNFSSTLQGSIGFLADERRLNVAITRPRHFLFIIGNSETLKKSPIWSNMIKFCQNTAQLIDISAETINKCKGMAVSLQKVLPPKLRKSKSRQEDSSSSEHDEQAAEENPYSNLFPDDEMKNELVENLYKRAVTKEQREELDLMVNDMKYAALKRQRTR